MSVSGFSAEESLHKTSHQYRTALTYIAVASASKVLLQQTWGHVPGGIGYCGWLCHNDLNCMDWCLSTNFGSMGNAGGGTLDPGVHCGPYRNGFQRCVVPHYGAIIQPCD
jgi:hypothetical protein